MGQFWTANRQAELEAHLAAHLSPHRLRHVAGVALTARSLALAHQLPPEAVAKAELAAWLHDLAREWKPPRLLEEARALGWPLGPLERSNPMAMLHAALGAEEARRAFGVEDPEVLQAVARHTFGAPSMSQLDMILFLADAVEPGRGEAPHVLAIRALAWEDLEAACLEALDQTLRYLIQSGQAIHPQAIAARNHLLVARRRPPLEPQ